MVPVSTSALPPKLSTPSSSRRWGIGDALLLSAVLLFGYGLFWFAYEWFAVKTDVVEIDLSPLALPQYTFFSMSRGLLAYVFSLLFTLVYGYWAAKDRVAGKLLVPLLDVLQSIPVLGFMPGLVLALKGAFPSGNMGLELAAVLMIFTGQAWNMTFSYYHSLRAVPDDIKEAATLYRFNWRQRLRWVELPYSAIGLVWNSMMSMAGGWFFLMINEAFKLGEHSFRLPGLGSYMSEAVDQGNIPAMIWAVVAMVTMIVALDQFLWRPVVVWSQKFRMEDAGLVENASSWFLDWVRKLRTVEWLSQQWNRKSSQEQPSRPRNVTTTPEAEVPHWALPLSRVSLAILIGVMLWGAWELVHLLKDVPWENWLEIILSAGWTLLRVLTAIVLGTLWTLPLGLAIGLSPKWSRIFQPIVQVAASFPAPMLFPAAIAALAWFGVSLNWGSVLLMLLGTQWYILFNVIAGAMAIPADLKEAARCYRFGAWQRFRVLYLPAAFSSLVTGWVTAAGGAWNASIVTEYVIYNKKTLEASGLGAQISKAAEHEDFPLLAAGVIVMAVIVVVFNRTVWKRLYRLAEERYSLNR